MSVWNGEPAAPLLENARVTHSDGAQLPPPREPPKRPEPPVKSAREIRVETATACLAAARRLLAKAEADLAAATAAIERGDASSVRMQIGNAIRNADGDVSVRLEQTSGATASYLRRLVAALGAAVKSYEDDLVKLDEAAA